MECIEKLKECYSHSRFSANSGASLRVPIIKLAVLKRVLNLNSILSLVVSPSIPTSLSVSPASISVQNRSVSSSVLISQSRLVRFSCLLSQFGIRLVSQLSNCELDSHSSRSELQQLRFDLSSSGCNHGNLSNMYVSACHFNFATA